MRQRGFTLIELVIILVIVGLLGAFAAAKYLNLLPQTNRVAELNAVGAVRAGIGLYGAESLPMSRTPRFPPALDSAPDGVVTPGNPFFTTVLSTPVRSNWVKSGLSYLGPTGNIYTYNPATGIFDANVGLVDNWNMNEGSGGTTGQGVYQGQIIGNATWTNGKVGDALHFDGIDSHVSVPDSPTLDLTTAGTVGAWIYMDAITPFGGIIHKGDRPDFSDEAYTLQFWTGNTIILGLNNGQYMVQTTTAFSPNTWYYVVGTWDSTGMRIYVNGTLNNSTTSTGAAINSSGSLNIGSQTSTYYNGTYRNFPFQGIIDEASIYNRALTADEIILYYNYTK
jgi:prepilin-type N-terminal cleavage/methylation domain-containing protein